MTRGGDVVYTDYHDMPINLVSNTVTQPPITLQGLKPLFLFSTWFDDTLVIMNNDDSDDMLTKVILVLQKNKAFNGMNNVCHANQQLIWISTKKPIEIKIRMYIFVWLIPRGL